MITLSQTGGTSGITTITISATSRSEMSDFVKKYTLANQNKSMLLAVTQKGYVPSGKYISFKPDSFSFDSSGGTGSLQVTSNDDWYIDFGSWVYPSEMKGNGNTIIGIRVEANTGSTRSGNITGYCLSDSAETASASISQVGSYVKPYLSVSPLRTPVIASGGTGFTLAVTSNQEWNAYTDARWVTINTVSGSGNGNISFEVGENATDIAREANIYVVSSASSLSATSVIAQSGQTHQEPYLVISPSAKTMSTSGGSFTITVSSNTEWETAVVYGGQERAWIALDKLNGYGDDVVEVRIEPDVQESISGRSAYISFFNNKDGLKTECNISQYDLNLNYQVYDDYYNVLITSADVPYTCVTPSGRNQSGFRIESLDFVQEDVKIAEFSYRPNNSTIELTMNSDSSFTLTVRENGVYVKTETLTSEDIAHNGLWHKYIVFYDDGNNAKCYHIDYDPTNNIFYIRYYDTANYPNLGDFHLTCEELY